MADNTKSKSGDKNADEMREMARKIWLAGIGAYGKAFTEGRELVKQASSKGSEVFEDLVARGEELEGDVDAKARGVMDDMKASVAELNLDDRIAKMRTRIRREGKKASRDMGSRMDDLESKFEELLDAIGGKEKAVKPTRAKAKTTTKRTAKTPAAKKKAPAKKKTTAKKPTAKKATTKKTSD